MLARSSQRTIGVILILGVAVSACGTNPGDRAVSGGLIGAGTGAAIGAVAGNAGAGALVGGLGGAAIGALTSPRAVNFGRPAWRQAHAHRKCVRWSASTGHCVRTAQVYARS